MGDYFTRLAERAMHSSSVARPLIAPMFAANAGATRSAGSHGMRDMNGADDIASEQLIEAAPERELSRPAPLVRPQHSAHSDAGLGAEFANRPTLDPAGRAKRTGESQISSSVSHPLREGDGASEKAALNSSEPRESEATPDQRGRTERFALEPHSTATATPRHSIAVRPQISIVAESKSSISKERQADQTRPDQTPSIHVTIGRIEVRAVTAPAPATPRSKQARSGSSLSLDEYLKQRDERKR